MGDSHVSTEMLLLGIAAGTSKSGQLLRDLGMSRDKLMPAIEHVRGGQKVTGEDPESSPASGRGVVRPAVVHRGKGPGGVRGLGGGGGHLRPGARPARRRQRGRRDVSADSTGSSIVTSGSASPAASARLTSGQARWWADVAGASPR